MTAWETTHEEDLVVLDSDFNENVVKDRMVLNR